MGERTVKDSKEVMPLNDFTPGLPDFDTIPEQQNLPNQVFSALVYMKYSILS